MKWVTVLFSLLTVSTTGAGPITGLEDKEWADMTEFERITVCEQDYRQGIQFVGLAEKFLEDGDYDRAWRGLDIAFQHLVKTFSCNKYPIQDDDQLYNKVRAALERVNELDDITSCAYHLKDATSFYTRSQLALEHLGDVEAAARYMGSSIFSYKDAMRFCPEDTKAKIEQALPQLNKLHEDLNALLENGN